MPLSPDDPRSVTPASHPADDGAPPRTPGAGDAEVMTTPGQRREMIDAPVISRSQIRGALVGVAIGAVAGGAVGALIALPRLFDMELGSRLLLLGVLGALAGAVWGGVMGGGQGPVRDGDAPGVREGTYDGHEADAGQDGRHGHEPIDLRDGAGHEGGAEVAPPRTHDVGEVRR